MNLDDYEGHTKGNWCIDDGNGVVKTDEFWIRLFEPYCDDGITEDEDTINKKLMMVAPDLLAEIKRLRGLLLEIWKHANECSEEPAEMDETLSAIARALMKESK